MAAHQRPEVGGISVGLCDNRGAFNEAFKANPVLTSPIFYAINHGIFVREFPADDAGVVRNNDFTEATIPTHISFVGIGRLRRAGIPLTDLNTQLVVMSETTAWMALPGGENAAANHIQMGEETARTSYRQAVWAFLKGPNIPARARGARQMLLDSDHVDHAGLLNVVNAAANQDDTINAPDTFTFIFAYTAMEAIITHVPGAHLITHQFLLVHTLIAFAKRGNISQQATQKVQDALVAEINYTGMIIPELITAYWSTFSGVMTSRLARAVVTRWTEFTPVHALRIRIMLQQTANSGLTQILTIARAIATFPTFPWHIPMRFYHEEIMRFQAGIQAMGGDPFYGFNPNLDAVKSTNFKNMGYWCKQLLVLGEGDTALNNFRGWTRNPTHAAKMTATIDTFIANLDNIADAPITDVETADVVALRAAVTGHLNNQAAAQRQE